MSPSSSKVGVESEARKQTKPAFAEQVLAAYRDSSLPAQETSGAFPNETGAAVQLGGGPVTTGAHVMRPIDVDRIDKRVRRFGTSPFNVARSASWAISIAIYRTETGLSPSPHTGSKKKCCPIECADAPCIGHCPGDALGEPGHVRKFGLFGAWRSHNFDSGEGR